MPRLIFAMVAFPIRVCITVGFTQNNRAIQNVKKSTAWACIFILSNSSYNIISMLASFSIALFCLANHVNLANQLIRKNMVFHVKCSFVVCKYTADSLWYLRKLGCFVHHRGCETSIPGRDRQKTSTTVCVMFLPPPEIGSRDANSGQAHSVHRTMILWQVQFLMPLRTVRLHVGPTDNDSLE